MASLEENNRVNIKHLLRKPLVAPFNEEIHSVIGGVSQAIVKRAMHICEICYVRGIPLEALLEREHDVVPTTIILITPSWEMRLHSVTEGEIIRTNGICQVIKGARRRFKWEPEFKNPL
jgi:hypothetical protein